MTRHFRLFPEGRGVQRIDGFYPYTIGKQIGPIGDLQDGSIEGVPISEDWRVFVTCYNAEQALGPFIDSSVFQLRTSRASGHALLTLLVDIRNKISASWATNKDGPVTEASDITRLKQALTIFESVLAAEMSIAPLYIVTPRGAFDIAILIDAGWRVFPAELGVKVPEAIPDIEQGTKCIAFALPTAAGFHFHRANESVLKLYWDAVSGGKPRPNDNNMGTYLREMDNANIGDVRVKASLRDLKDYHRNPLIHPDHSLENVDEAIALMNAIQSAMVNMLKAIPDPPVPPTP